MKPGSSPCVLIGPRCWETPPPGLAKQVSGLAGVPGPGVSFTKVNETKGTGWGGSGERKPELRQRKCTNQRSLRAHYCPRRPENKLVCGGLGAGAASLPLSPAALAAAPGQARDPPAAPAQKLRPQVRLREGEGGRVSVIPRLTANTPPPTFSPPPLQIPGWVVGGAGIQTWRGRGSCGRANGARLACSSALERARTHTHTYTHTSYVTEPGQSRASESSRNSDPDSQEQVGPPLAGGEWWRRSAQQAETPPPPSPE